MYWWEERLHLVGGGAVAGSYKSRAWHKKMLTWNELLRPTPEHHVFPFWDWGPPRGTFCLGYRYWGCLRKLGLKQSLTKTIRVDKGDRLLGISRGISWMNPPPWSRPHTDIADMPARSTPRSLTDPYTGGICANVEKKCAGLTKDKNPLRKFGVLENHGFGSVRLCR